MRPLIIICYDIIVCIALIFLSCIYRLKKIQQKKKKQKEIAEMEKQKRGQGLSEGMYG